MGVADVLFPVFCGHAPSSALHVGSASSLRNEVCLPSLS
jgi:hypothetical protein